MNSRVAKVYGSSLSATLTDVALVYHPTSFDTKLNLDNVPNRENVIALWIKDISDPDKKVAAMKKLRLRQELICRHVKTWNKTSSSLLCS